jgi:hypothetical protein
VDYADGTDIWSSVQTLTVGALRHSQVLAG